MLVGHETLACQDCHKDERGTLRQRLQANVQYLLGNRKHAVSAGYRPVANRECLHCHSRPNDRHPVYRFLEPRYRKVRQSIGADRCVSCHLEHNSMRISIKPEFCQHCHDDLKLRNDPVDTPHHVLVKTKRWTTCLGCHDFHGNHKMKTPDKMANVINKDKIEQYFDRAQHPYPGNIIHQARKTENEK